jgi:capsular polysaccharide biosynthesis protein
MTARERPGSSPARRVPAVLRRARRVAAGRIEPSGPPQGSAALLGPAGARCVVIADPDHPERAQQWLSESRADRVLVLTPDAAGWSQASDSASDSLSVREAHRIDELVREVQKFGRIDVILALLPKRRLPDGVSDQYDLFSRLFLYLRSGGTYIVDRTVEGSGRSALGANRWRQLLAVADDPEADEREVGFAAAVGTLVVSRNMVLVTKRGRHLLKLRGSDVDEVLPDREPATTLTMLASRPAGSFESRAVETSYGPRVGEPLPRRMDYPAMSLRHYEGSIGSAGGMRLFTPDTILPDSFRWYFASGGGSPRLDSLTGDMARIPPKHLPRRRLAGDYYNLDCLFDGHFGHLTTEVVSRLWGWDQAKRENPDLKALFHVRPKRNNDPVLERALFTAYGIREEDLVWVEGPVKVRGLVSATPMWQDQSPHFAHPDITEIWQRLTAGLLGDAEPAEHERIFVSRGEKLSHRRCCRNQAEVERFFADRGFHVFYPEQLSLTEQVALFAGARVVAGFSGSAMFNLMHTKRLEATIVLGQNAYLARNEQLFSTVLGGELHYFWSPADVPPPEIGKRTKASVRSSWAFDFAEQGADLERVIAAH